MIALLSKNRSRNQIINKFHKEEKENPNKVEQALKAHRKCDTKIVKKYIKYFDQMNSTRKSSGSSRKGSNASHLDNLVLNRTSRHNSINSLDSVD